MWRVFGNFHFNGRKMKLSAAFKNQSASLKNSFKLARSQKKFTSFVKHQFRHAFSEICMYANHSKLVSAHIFPGDGIPTLVKTSIPTFNFKHRVACAWCTTNRNVRRVWMSQLTTDRLPWPTYTWWAHNIQWHTTNVLKLGPSSFHGWRNKERNWPHYSRSIFRYAWAQVLKTSMECVNWIHPFETQWLLLHWMTWQT